MTCDPYLILKGIWLIWKLYNISKIFNKMILNWDTINTIQKIKNFQTESTFIFYYESDAFDKTPFE